MTMLRMAGCATIAAMLLLTGGARAAESPDVMRQRALEAKRTQQQPAAKPTPQPQVRAAPIDQGRAVKPQPSFGQPARPRPTTVTPQVTLPQSAPSGERRGGYGGYSGGGREVRGGDRRDRVRNGVAIGAGIAIIGGVIGYNAYRGPYRDRVYERCDRNFPDFDYETGSFVNDDGDREICPYLLD